MDTFVIAQNIAIFRLKLLTVKDEGQRRTLIRLLAEEEVKNHLPREPRPVDPLHGPVPFLQ